MTTEDLSQLSTIALQKKKQLRKVLLGLSITVVLAGIASVLYLSIVQRLFSSSFVAIFAMVPLFLLQSIPLQPIDDELNNRKR